MRLEAEPHCFTCLHAIGSEQDTGLDCTLRGLRCLRLCPFYEREAGADVPERFGNIDSAVTWSAVTKLPPLSRVELRDRREERN